MTFRSTLVLSFLLSALGACGDDAAPSSQGYTDCGSVTCQPGQYCEDSRFSSCVDGCLSDANCLGNQYCDTADLVPTCLNRSTPTPTDGGPPPADRLAACQSACDHFQSCGLAAGETAQCRSDCAALTSDQQQAVANCDGLACSATPGCLGIDCFSDDQCGFGEECVGGACL